LLSIPQVKSLISSRPLPSTSSLVQYSLLHNHPAQYTGLLQTIHSISKHYIFQSITHTNMADTRKEPQTHQVALWYTSWQHVCALPHKMATKLEKSFSVLEYARCSSVIAVQRAFKPEHRKEPPCKQHSAVVSAV
jgi:hypothetical protein